MTLKTPEMTGTKSKFWSKFQFRLDSVPATGRNFSGILNLGKYSYLRLPMGVACAPDIFQAKMSELMSTLEFVRAYIDDH
jgi:hypothetical protein